MRIADNPLTPGTPAAQLALWPAHPDAADLPETRLRHSRRARRVAVRIDATGHVELVVPRGVSEARAWSFLASRADWVRSHLQRRRQLQPVEQEFPPASIALPALGERWRLFHAGGCGRLQLRERAEGILELRGQGSNDQLRRRLLDWLLARATQAFTSQLQELAQRHGFMFSAVQLRRQRTRWGSCSTRGVISLNLALLFQRPAVLRYLLCHELAHTKHMNHSARFWDCVAQCEPDWRALDAELCQGWRHVPRWLLESA
jgi:predicted metal-dependent hydrolase